MRQRSAEPRFTTSADSSPQHLTCCIREDGASDCRKHTEPSRPDMTPSTSSQLVVGERSKQAQSFPGPVPARSKHFAGFECRRNIYEQIKSISGVEEEKTDSDIVHVWVSLECTLKTTANDHVRVHAGVRFHAADHPTVLLMSPLTEANVAFLERIN